ncbi:hypothetical protein [Mucilaginibacter defluvii]|uniref:Uncharacterized protein n=1 Tax=Mucilaginibacter defluvii TaxID=1196019 RepID=A0ABP9FL76_9SPHI
MSTEKLAAHTQNRTFYFTIVQQSEQEIRISMYNTSYTLIKQNVGWRNAPTNYFNMAQHLIDAVVEAVTEADVKAV